MAAAVVTTMQRSLDRIVLRHARTVVSKENGYGIFIALREKSAPLNADCKNGYQLACLFADPERECARDE